MVQSHNLKSQTSCNYVPVNFFLHFATTCSVSLKTRAPQRQVFANIWKCFGLLLSIGHGSRRTMLMTLTLPVETDSWKKDISSCCMSLFQRDELWSATATLFRNNFQHIPGAAIVSASTQVVMKFRIERQWTDLWLVSPKVCNSMHEVVGGIYRNISE